MRAGMQAKKASFFRRDPAAIPRISCRPNPPRPFPAAPTGTLFFTLSRKTSGRYIGGRWQSSIQEMACRQNYIHQ
jgi:hypothetical protein